MNPQWLEDLKAETSKFYEKGNKSAGTRARKSLQDIKALCQAGRTHIQGSKVEAPKA